MNIVRIVEPEINTHKYIFLEQIMVSDTKKTAAVQPLTSHLKNHPSKTNKVIRDTAGEARMKLGDVLP